MDNLKTASHDEKELAAEIRTMLTDPTPEQMKQIGVVFDRLLSKRGMSRRDWIEQQGQNFDESALSHMFAGRRKSSDLGRAVCAYIINASA